MRILAAAALAIALALLVGCTETFTLIAYVDPPTGNVPYTANIVANALPGTYTYELPDGSTTTTRSNSLAVTVDRLMWEARVSWTDGTNVCVAIASATGINERPRILAPRLNGDAYLGTLRPREATLIDFSHYEAGLSGPESGVVYDGAWYIVSVRLAAEEKVVCGAIMEDCIYTPPWEDGGFHALFRGQMWENACIVYPLFTSELAPNGRPYAPEPLPGYTFDGARNRNLLLGVEFPEQTATVRVVVEDDWGRLTEASFPFQVAATSFWDHVSDGSQGDAPGGADKPTLFKNAVFFVSDPRDPYYYRRDCPEVCAIPASERLYFSSEASAEAAGKRRSPDCPEY